VQYVDPAPQSQGLSGLLHAHASPFATCFAVVHLVLERLNTAAGKTTSTARTHEQGCAYVCKLHGTPQPGYFSYNFGLPSQHHILSHGVAWMGRGCMCGNSNHIRTNIVHVRTQILACRTRSIYHQHIHATVRNSGRLH
jgi:hypothetical protein